MMNKHIERNDQNLDNLLAAFVDEVLKAKDSESLLSQQKDLAALQETVIKLKTVLVDDSSDVRMAERIQRNLAVEWSKQKTAARAQTASAKNWRTWLHNLFKKPSFAAPRTFAWSFTTVAVLILAALVVFNMDMNDGQPGTVLGPAGWIPLAVLVVGGGVFALVWFLKSRR